MNSRRYAKVAVKVACSAALALFGASTALAKTAPAARLQVDPKAFTLVHVTLDGKPLALRRYEAVYVRKPVAMAANQPARRMGPGGSPAAADKQVLANPLAYQSLYVFVPEGAKADAAIILNVNNGGWFASELRAGIRDGGSYQSTSNTDKVGAALAAGYVYVDVGTRGRGIVAADGTYPGHAPAAVIDTKAAIRWLRLNDAALPGSAERIVVTGTSGGGGLTAVIAASGDSPDFLPELARIGAAGISRTGKSTLSDAVFAAIAYCPITDLGHADLAYEWLYGPVRSAGGTRGNTGGGQWMPAQMAASARLAAGYPAYLDSLHLKLADGRALTAATMRDAIGAQVIAEVEHHIAQGGTVPARGEPFNIAIPRMFGGSMQITRANDWVTVSGGKVTDFDLGAFLTFVAAITPLKPVPAFDRSHNSGNTGIDGENTLFGAADQAWSNFTPYGWEANDVAGDGSGADDAGLAWKGWITHRGQPLARQLRMIDPFSYLGAEAKARVAPYWYVRHGMIDRDTAFPVEIALSRAIAGDSAVKELDFALPWMTPHSGDYDVQSAYRWLKKVISESGSW
ncbi:subtype B tannase [Novosphingobium olei]|uniref:Alpha/beta hydrolase fold domain-containing protein n=1 Tax=Novosphingobium olei TaxID=2728851 RepID=A0A7Y0GAU0_9SPHN|nr:subtype B tannase [Novosphingobium olei]NML93967.1 alpha/beta hydrolase fold domain-containing protein [Novosphingobium olei]